MDNTFSRSSFVAGTAAVALTTGVARAQTAPVALRMAGSVNDDVTPMLYAVSSGLMRRAGIDITIEKGTSGSAVSAGVVGGAHQIGKSSVAGLITAHAKGVPFKLVEIPLSAVPAALAAGRIDAGCPEEPEVSEALAGGTSRVLGRLFDSIAPRFMYTGWFSTLDWATQNRALLDKFRAAYREATNYSNAHKTETVDLSSKFTLIDPKIVAKGVRVTGLATLDPKMIQPVIEASAKYKAIPASFDARDMIDPALR